MLNNLFLISDHSFTSLEIFGYICLFGSLTVRASKPVVEPASCEYDLVMVTAAAAIFGSTFLGGLSCLFSITVFGGKFDREKQRN